MRIDPLSRPPLAVYPPPDFTRDDACRLLSVLAARRDPAPAAYSPGRPVRAGRAKTVGISDNAAGGPDVLPMGGGWRTGA